MTWYQPHTIVSKGKLIYKVYHSLLLLIWVYLRNLSFYATLCSVMSVLIATMNLLSCFFTFYLWWIPAFFSFIGHLVDTLLFLFSLFLLQGYCQYNHQALLSSVLFTWFAWCHHAYYGFHCSSRKSGCVFFPQCKYSSVHSHLCARGLRENWAVFFLD